MGLLTGLLTLPLAPVRGVAWIADTLVRAAEEEFYDQDRLLDELRELAGRLDSGEITAAEFDQQEDLLLDRLQQAAARAPIR